MSDRKFDKIYHLITPGLDSLCGYYYILENFPQYLDHIELIHIVLSPTYGYVEVEKMEHLTKYLKEVNVITFDGHVQEMKDGFIPARNLALATLLDLGGFVDHKCKSLISFGFTKDDRVYDSSEEYCSDVSKVLSPNVTMGSALRNLSKLELVEWFLSKCQMFTKEEKEEIIRLSYSCYAPYEDECLKCNACFRKSVILHSLGVETRPVASNEFLKVRMNILNDSDVSNERKESIMKYVKALGELD